MVKYLLLTNLGLLEGPKLRERMYDDKAEGSRPVTGSQ